MDHGRFFVIWMQFLQRRMIYNGPVEKCEFAVKGDDSPQPPIRYINCYWGESDRLNKKQAFFDSPIMGLTQRGEQDIGLPESLMQSSEEVVLVKSGELAVLHLGSPENVDAILSERRLHSLNSALDDIARDDVIKGLVVIGAGDEVFCRGADLGELYALSAAQQLREWSERGQQILQKLASLRLRSVAAILGPCLGAGCELALACNYRIIASTPDTRIGLPEVKLGIVPGFGGTQWLPRTVGLPSALALLIQGKVVCAEEAVALGLCDLLVSAEAVDEGRARLANRLQIIAAEVALGRRVLAERCSSLRESLETNNPIGRKLVCARFKAMVAQESAGVYPAPARARDLVLAGLDSGLSFGLKEEAMALAELAGGEIGRSLLHLYLASESAKRIGSSAARNFVDCRVAVVGSSESAVHCAASCVSHGMHVICVVGSQDRQSDVAEAVKASLLQRGQVDSGPLSRLSVEHDFASVGEAEIIIELSEETWERKRELLVSLSRAAHRQAVIAVQSDSILVSQLAQCIGQSKRVVGMRFFPPFSETRLVEIVRGEETSTRALVISAALAEKMGKHAVVVEDCAGALVHRLLFPYFFEAWYLLPEGYRVEAIDDACEAFGMPLGPFRLLDEIGLDVAVRVAETLANTYGERMRGPKYCAQLVAAGRFGRKSGAGFYDYRVREPRVDRVISEMLGLSGSTRANGSQVPVERMLLRLINEGVRCLDEGVAGAPGGEAAGQIDLALVMRRAFPKYRGGVLHYAEALSADQVWRKSMHLVDRYGGRFAPCEGIVRRARQKGSFYAPL